MPASAILLPLRWEVWGGLKRYDIVSHPGGERPDELILVFLSQLAEEVLNLLQWHLWKDGAAAFFPEPAIGAQAINVQLFAVETPYFANAERGINAHAIQ